MSLHLNCMARMFFAVYASKATFKLLSRLTCRAFQAQGSCCMFAVLSPPDSLEVATSTSELLSFAGLVAPYFVRAAHLQNRIAPPPPKKKVKSIRKNGLKNAKKDPKKMIRNVPKKFCDKPLSRRLKISHRHFSTSSSPPKIGDCQRGSAMEGVGEN